MLRLVIKKGSFYVILLDENENEVAYYDPSNPFILTMPYDLENGQHSNSVVAIYKNGKVIPFSIYKDGSITFSVIETGIYDVIYNKKDFTDISGHWAEDSIDFVTARTLYTGIGNGQFDPNGNMTRAMFAQVLANLDGADLSIYETSRFTDVPDNAWYMAAVEWAADIGIVSGVGNDRFDPNAPITREQMAVMLYRYMEYKGFNLEANGISTAFADEDDISLWALEAVSAIQGMGIVIGKQDNAYDPKATASRAEVATVFARLVEKGAA